MGKDGTGKGDAVRAWGSGDLVQYARRVRSHAGEDGILERIFTLLDRPVGTFVEFGAWDGQRLSNSRALIERGWTGVLIEADPEKFRALQANVTAPGVTLVRAEVGLEGEASLDAILARVGAPEHIDVLSIDIDGDDLAVWLAAKRVRATCVVIEYNVTIPFDCEFVNPRGRNWGNSALSICRFAKARGYVLVAMTGMNLIFLDRRDAQAAGLAEFPLIQGPVGPRYFWGYDGTLLSAHERSGRDMAEVLRVPFHDFRFAQPVPGWLRRWHLGREWRRAERVASALMLGLLRPLAWAKDRRQRSGRKR